METKTKFLFWLALAASLAGCAAERASIQRPGLRGPSHRLAVLPFESANPYIPGAVLGDYFTVSILQNLDDVDVIERKDLMKVLQEQKLSLSGVIRPEKCLAIGSILGVDAVIVGLVQTLETIQSASGPISVTVKMVDVATGKVLWADREKISHAAWPAREVPEVAAIIMEKAAEKMVKKMAGRLPPRSELTAGLADELIRTAAPKIAQSRWTGGRHER